MLLDSNIVIYAAQAEYADLRQFISANETAAVSIVSLIEIFGYPDLDEEDNRIFQEILRKVRILALDPVIVVLAIALRQQRRIGLGDAIIAATALEHGLTLITRNTRDFRWITNLRLLNPMEEQEQNPTTEN